MAGERRLVGHAGETTSGSPGVADGVVVGPPDPVTTGSPAVLEQRLALALETAGIGSWELDPATDRVLVDARMRELFGLPSESLLTRSAVFADPLPLRDRERVARALERAVSEGVDYAEEHRVVHPDGTVHWVTGRGRPFYDGEGRLERVVGSAVDTTTRYEASARAEATSELLTLIASASELLASSLEPADAVRSLARLVVPRLADWSVVSLVTDDGLLQDVDWWHRDPAKVEVTARFATHRLVGRDEPAGLLLAFSSRQPVLVDREATAFALRTLRSQDAVDAVRQLDLDSVAIFPLLTDAGEVIGLLSLARGEDRHAFTPEEIAAAVDLCHRASTTLENARSFGREREMSEQLQRSMLTEPAQPEHLEVVARYSPAAKAVQVGGDWYDAFAQPDGSTVLVVGDVVGHDSVAAAVMGQLRSMLRGIAVATGGGPADVLTQLDRSLLTLRMWTTATVVVARLETGHGTGAAAADPTVTLRWSNAGHPPPLLVLPEGEVLALAEHDPLLGVDHGLVRGEQSLVLAPGSTLLLYTDGLVERRDVDIDDRVEVLRTSLAGLGELPLATVVDRLLVDLLPEEPDDDVVVLAVRLVEPPAAPSQPASIPGTA